MKPLITKAIFMAVIALAASSLSAQRVVVEVANEDRIACFQSKAKARVECPAGQDCYGIVNFGSGNGTDTIRPGVPKEHTYTNDGMYSIETKVMQYVSDDRPDSLLAEASYRDIIQLYSPLGTSILYDTASGGKSYIIELGIDASKFIPFDTAAWTYTWVFHDGDSHFSTSYSEKLIKEYPDENNEPGYDIMLIAALSGNSEASQFVQDYLSCRDTIRTEIAVNDDFFVPDSTMRMPNLPNMLIVSGDPNSGNSGNSGNSVFGPVTNGVDIFSLQIFNMYGNLVFSQKGKEVSWTGFSNSGKRAKAGSYYFVIESNAGSKHNAKGFVHVFNRD
jgi:hypothetical protein